MIIITEPTSSLCPKCLSSTSLAAIDRKNIVLVRCSNTLCEDYATVVHRFTLDTDEFINSFNVVERPRRRRRRRS